MAGGGQPAEETFDVAASEEDRIASFDRTSVRAQIELGRVHGAAPRREALHLPPQKLQSQLDRSAVLERARRPGEVEVPQIAGKMVHVDRPERHESAEGSLVAQAV